MGTDTEVYDKSPGPDEEATDEFRQPTTPGTRSPAVTFFGQVGLLLGGGPAKTRRRRIRNSTGSARTPASYQAERIGSGPRASNMDRRTTPRRAGRRRSLSDGFSASNIDVKATETLGQIDSDCQDA